MGIHDEFCKAAVEHPQWEIIRGELCSIDYDYEDPEVFQKIWYGEGFKNREEQVNEELFGEICWHINNGPGYCERAPEHIKKYLRRLDIKC